MYQIIIFLHVIISIALIVLILLQQGKGAQIGAAFGSGASQTVFGSQGSASFLMRVTGGLAVAFFATSIILAAIATHQYKAAKRIELPAQSAPAIPAEVPATQEIPPAVEKEQATTAPVSPAKQAQEQEKKQ